MSPCPWLAGAALLASLTLVPQASKPAAPKPPIAFDGSSIVSFQVKSIDASKAWFRTILGSELVYELPSQGWCEISTPVAKQLVGFMQVDPPRPGGATLSFGVSKIEAARDFLRSKDVRLESDIVEIPKTVKLLYFFDPDGNRLMFYEPFKGQ